MEQDADGHIYTLMHNLKEILIILKRCIDMEFCYEKHHYKPFDLTWEDLHELINIIKDNRDSELKEKLPEYLKERD